MTPFAVALGSNVGDRAGYLEQAIRRLRAEPRVVVDRVSAFYETAPVDCPAGSGDFLNAALVGRTTLPPEALFRVLLNLEAEFGRVRTTTNAPRTLDLDLLLWGQEVRSTPDLILPHPRMHLRRFVLQPLAEIAADWVVPSQSATVAECLARLPDQEPLRLWPRPLSTGPRELSGQRIVVTGSTSGIGRAIALELAAAGAAVLIHGRRSPERAQQVADEVARFGVPSAVCLADLSQESACDHLVEVAWRTWNGLDGWVNNAGADTLTGPAAKWSFEHKLEALWAVDVKATIRLSRQVGERMRHAQGGVILTMGWDQAELGMEGDSGQLFATTKAAIQAFTRSLALSLAPRVRVNALAPGWIRTAWGETASDDWQERVRRETPLRRWGLPEDVAQAVRWLLSPAAQFVTGQTIRINGGAVRV